MLPSMMCINFMRVIIAISRLLSTEDFYEFMSECVKLVIFITQLLCCTSYCGGLLVLVTLVNFFGLKETNQQTQECGY